MRLCECADDQIVVKITAPVPMCGSMAGWIAQALATLIHNALTHGASREKPEISVRESTGWIEFLVSDSGPGCRKASEIFAKFVRGPGAPAGGVGLGLSIARHLAEIHGGSLNAWNRKEAGALFTLRIPTGGTMKIPE